MTQDPSAQPESFEGQGPSTSPQLPLHSGGGATERNEDGNIAPGRRNGVVALIAAGISAGVLVLVVIVTVLAVITPFLTGSQGYNIMTDSMRPAYPPGTLVVVKPVDSEDLRIGDVITYQIDSGKPAVITHRIIATTLSSNGARSFTTMGDNNAVADPEPIREEQIHGRVWYALPWIGSLSSARENGPFGIVIPIAGFGLILYSGYLVISWFTGKSRRSSPSREADAE